jgi:hypothetical protein
MLLVAVIKFLMSLSLEEQVVAVVTVVAVEREVSVRELFQQIHTILQDLL